MSGESFVPVVRASASTSSHAHTQGGQAQPRQIAGGTRTNTGELA